MFAPSASSTEAYCDLTRASSVGRHDRESFGVVGKQLSSGLGVTGIYNRDLARVDAVDPRAGIAIGVRRGRLPAIAKTVARYRAGMF